MVSFAGGILQRDGKVLLGLRSPHRRSFPDCWDIIGGHVEPGESPEETLVRELEEEIGVTPRAFRSAGVILIAGAEGEASGPLHVFIVDDWIGEPAMRGDEHSALRWMMPAEAADLPGLALQDYRPLIAALSLPPA